MKIQAARGRGTRGKAEEGERGTGDAGGSDGVRVAASRAGQERWGGGWMPTKGLSPSGPSLPDSASPSALTRLGPGTPPPHPRAPPGRSHGGCRGGGCLPQSLSTGPTSVSAQRLPFLPSD